jgi:hypothetical protein
VSMFVKAKISGWLLLLPFPVITIGLSFLEKSALKKSASPGDKKRLQLKKLFAEKHIVRYVGLSITKVYDADCSLSKRRSVTFGFVKSYCNSGLYMEIEPGKFLMVKWTTAFLAKTLGEKNKIKM